jgi:uncharacterized protein
MVTTIRTGRPGYCASPGSAQSARISSTSARGVFMERNQSMADAVSQWPITAGGQPIRAVFTGNTQVVIVCAHGAGGRMDDRGMLAIQEQLNQRGAGVVRFNFPYRERGSRAPDPMPRLQQCFQAVVAQTREALAPRRLIIGGRSMGGRVASMLAADGMECDGLLLLAYPLHPAGKPDKLRAAHLAKIRKPVLCFNGTRDALCRKELMEAALKSVKAPWRMHWLQGADHSFHVLKSSGTTDREILDEIGQASGRWLCSLD